jgi:hypothetical protein
MSRRVKSAVPTTTVRIPRRLRERAEQLAIALGAVERRVVAPSEALARAAERGLDDFESEALALRGES